MVIPKDKQKSTGVIRWIRILAVFIFAAFAWIFFVSNSLGEAVYVIIHAWDGLTNPISYLKGGFAGIGMGKMELARVAIPMVLLAVYDYFSLKMDVISEIGKMRKVTRWTIYVLLVLILVFMSQKGIAAEFVYFQF